jgi:hypothetical protein
MLSHQDGHHSAVALLLKAALIQVSDYRLLGASGSLIDTPRYIAEILLQKLALNTNQLTIDWQTMI